MVVDEEMAGEELVALGSFMVRRGVLEAPGTSLQTLIDALPMQLNDVATMLESLPKDSWRRVHAYLDPGADTDFVLAAPYAGKPDGWSLLTLTGHANQWALTSDPGPVVAVSIQN